MTFTDHTVKPRYCRTLERESLRLRAAARIDFRELVKEPERIVRLGEHDPALRSFVLAWERHAGAALARFVYLEDPLLLCAMLARPPGRKLLTTCARQARLLWQEPIGLPSHLVPPAPSPSCCPAVSTASAN